MADETTNGKATSKNSRERNWKSRLTFTMNDLISQDEAKEVLGINDTAFERLRGKGLKGAYLGGGKWVYFVPQLVETLLKLRPKFKRKDDQESS